MLRRCGYVIALLALCWLGERNDASVPVAAAARSHQIRVETVSRGLRLTLIVPESAYPRNALVQVTLLLQNVSGHTILLNEVCHSRLHVEDTSASGKRILLFTLPGAPPRIGGCMGSSYQRLAPGQTLATQQYVVLQGPGLRAYDPTRHITTRTAMVTFVSGSAPRVTVSPWGRLHATVYRPPGAAGPLLISQWTSCLDHGMPLAEVNPDWTEVPGSVVTPWVSSPECQPIVEWHAYVGYVGWPVARINYKAS